MYPSSDKNLTYETDDTVYWFSTPFEPLNNWSAHAITIWGKTFTTLEHGYHYRKFSETAPEIASEIMTAPSPWAAMQIERRNKAKLRDDWKEVKIAIMTELLRAKVEQNEDVRECLLKTGDKRLVENSPWDSFWGCGADGKGQNWTGKLLMQVRNEINQQNQDALETQ